MRRAVAGIDPDVGLDPPNPVDEDDPLGRRSGDRAPGCPPPRRHLDVGVDLRLGGAGRIELVGRSVRRVPGIDGELHENTFSTTELAVPLRTSNRTGTRAASSAT